MIFFCRQDAGDKKRLNDILKKEKHRKKTDENLESVKKYRIFAFRKDIGARWIG